MALGDQRCPICGASYVNDMGWCRSCSQLHMRLVREGKIPTGVDFSNWEAMYKKAREMRAGGASEEEVKAAVKERFDHLHAIWETQSHPTVTQIRSSEEIENELPY